ncbi:hypothetical protein BDV93DRAFT_506663 [Ceratobasidium sp. AG-I]|nr:hypothetical protein BDV93DRAFT_506663 [Ceratobasidium sp. AG-I]
MVAGLSATGYFKYAGLLTGRSRRNLYTNLRPIQNFYLQESAGPACIPALRKVISVSFIYLELLTVSASTIKLLTSLTKPRNQFPNQETVCKSWLETYKPLLSEPYYKDISEKEHKGHVVMCLAQNISLRWLLDSWEPSRSMPLISYETILHNLCGNCRKFASHREEIQIVKRFDDRVYTLHAKLYKVLVAGMAESNGTYPHFSRLCSTDTDLCIITLIAVFQLSGVGFGGPLAALSYNYRSRTEIDQPDTLVVLNST